MNAWTPALIKIGKGVMALCFVVGMIFEWGVGHGELSIVGEDLAILGAVGLALISITNIFMRSLDKSLPRLVLIDTQSKIQMSLIALLLSSLVVLFTIASAGLRSAPIYLASLAAGTTASLSGVALSWFACVHFGRWYKETTRVGGFRRRSDH